MMCVAAIAIATVTWALVGYSLAFDEAQRDHRRARPRVPEGRRRFEPREGTDDPAPAVLRLPGDLLHHHRGAGLGRGRGADALRRVPDLRGAVVGARVRGAGALGVRRRLAVRTAARWTSRAASPSRWARASRRSRPRWSSGRARTTGARRCCRTTPSTCCSGAGLLWFGWFGFNGGSGFGTGNASVLAFTNTLLLPGGTLVTWFILDLIRGRQVTAIGAATAIIVGCVGITPAGGFISPGWAHGARRARRAAQLRRDRAAPAHARRRDARRARRARHRGLHGHPLHRLLRAGVLERRVRRPRLRQRRAARRPGAGGRSRPRSMRSSPPTCCCG